ncbi:hypothetical protein EN780_06415 [Mesorhizobium sp. M4B.F.Ca.ET.089.01.1.1]|uniref:hypothetical protein n=1 Tax=Mesorhizobium sp. M4B.F.Ca.ET.089.01.1.1 TaxID=2496662 RepID=UPI000FE2B36F|nr:hypothetical protein [Mesorhizobium sp. M4B.F.Ca.ET.089.01.1.1]RWX69387.1 hypothetical protein EN780_06415 [Mesorhizobium sp. M4B.F.Ca.ET.089.01.1.1]
MDEKDLILPVNIVPTIGDFLGALRIKPLGLGAQLFTGVYEQFFVSSIDLKDEYKKYYCVEYPTLASYLELTHEIYLDEGDLGKRYILKIKSPSGVLDQAYDGNVLDIVVNCIEKLEEAHEG